MKNSKKTPVNTNNGLYEKYKEYVLSKSNYDQILCHLSQILIGLYHIEVVRDNNKFKHSDKWTDNDKFGQGLVYIHPFFIGVPSPFEKDSVPPMMIVISDERHINLMYEGDVVRIGNDWISVDSKDELTYRVFGCKIRTTLYQVIKKPRDMDKEDYDFVELKKDSARMSVIEEDEFVYAF